MAKSEEKRGIRSVAMGTKIWVEMRWTALAILIVIAYCGNALGAAHLSDLLGHESPLDQSDPLAYEYGGPSQVLSGVMGVDDSSSEITVFMAAFGGGLIALHYSPTYGGNRVLDRAIGSGGGQLLYALDACGVNETSTSYVDTIFEISQDANLTSPSFTLHRLSSDGATLSYQAQRSLSERPTAMTCTPTIAAPSVPVVFLALSHGVVAWDQALSSNDTLETTFTPTALSYLGGVSITGSTKDYLIVGGSGGEIAIYEVDPTFLGDSNTTNAFRSTGIASVVDGVPQAIATYSSSDVDANDTSDEAFIFVGTDNGIFLFELDDNGSDPQELVLEYKGNITQKFGVALDVKDIFPEPAGTSSLRASFLIAACGSKGTLFFKTGGNEDTGSSSTDTFFLEHLATFPTSSQAIKVLGTGGSANSNSIDRVYLLEVGGLKVVETAGLSSPDSATISLVYQWSTAVFSVDVGLFTVAGTEFGLVQTASGELRVYDLSPSQPHLVVESSENATGVPLLQGSSQEGGRVVGMFALQDPSDEGMFHVFSAISGSGIIYSRLDGVGATGFTHATSAYHALEGGISAVHGFLSGTNKFILGVARGALGLMLLEFDPATEAFTEKSFIVLASPVESVFLVSGQDGSDYAYVGTGDGGFLIFNVTESSSTGSRDYLSNPELVGSITLPSSYRTSISKMEVIEQGDSRYYAYILGSNGRLFTVDVTNPLSPTYLSVFPGDGDTSPGEIEDFTLVRDQSTGREYAICASSAQYSEDDQRRIIFTINCNDPATMLMGSTLAVDPLEMVFTPRAIAVEQSGGGPNLKGFFGAGLGASGYLGIVGTFNVLLTGPQSVYASFYLDTCPAAPGDTVYITPSVSGGEPPYSYSWSISGVEDMGTGSWQWKTPDIPGMYKIIMTVMDSDGNKGIASRQCRVAYRGVSVARRIATPSSQVDVPLNINGIENSVDAWGIEVQFDPNLVELVDVEAGDDTLGWTISVEDKAQGRVRLGGVANGHRSLPPGVSATLSVLRFSVKDVSGYGSRSCLEQGIFASVSPVAISPSTLMVDLDGAELHAGGIQVVLPGDVDGDSCVTPQDALNVFLGFLGTLELREDEMRVGDVDRDGRLSPNDAVMILDRYLR